jgi:hypothetical protein
MRFFLNSNDVWWIEESGWTKPEATTAGLITQKKRTTCK